MFDMPKSLYTFSYESLPIVPMQIIYLQGVSLQFTSSMQFTLHCTDFFNKTYKIKSFDFVKIGKVHVTE